jgi:hypothetical protein
MNADKTLSATMPTLPEKTESAATGSTEIRVRGKTIHVPSIQVNNHPVVVTGKWLKVAAVKDDDLVAGSVFENPQQFVNALERSNLGADIFSFSQKLPDVEPKHSYPLEWDNAAVVPITTYKEWLEKRVEYDVRKAIKKAAKLGVVCRTAEFNDELVKGIVGIYGESSTRQGRAFWHYQKDFDTVKMEAGTHLDKSEFIGAYFENELIGFIKMAHIGKITATIHVIAMKKHFDKKVTNAMLAKAVEICEQRGSTHLMYGNYIYNDPTSSLTEFKRRNGFEKVMLPKYYVPLTFKGRMALKWNAHHGLSGILPPRVKQFLVKTRKAVGERLRSEKRSTEPAPARAESPKGESPGAESPSAPAK